MHVWTDSVGTCDLENPDTLRITDLFAYVKRHRCSFRDANKTRTSPCRVATAFFHAVTNKRYIALSTLPHFHFFDVLVMFSRTTFSSPGNGVPFCDIQIKFIALDASQDGVAANA